MCLICLTHSFRPASSYSLQQINKRQNALFSTHLIFRNACTVPLGRHSLEIITTEKGGIVEGIFMERSPHILLSSYFCSNPLTLLAIAAPVLLLRCVQQTQSQLTKEEVVPNMTTAETWASSDYLFGGGENV